MARSIATLTNLLLQCCYLARRVWWRIASPQIDTCRILCTNPAGEVLLVRHTYGASCWMLPGGGMKRMESPVESAVRELEEETGCRLLYPHEIGVVTERVKGATIHVHIVRGTTFDFARPHNREIADTGFFAPLDLPADTAIHVMTQLHQYLR